MAMAIVYIVTNVQNSKWFILLLDSVRFDKLKNNFVFAYNLCVCVCVDVHCYPFDLNGWKGQRQFDYS